jgi:hypothetical protein
MKGKRRMKLFSLTAIFLMLLFVVGCGDKKEGEETTPETTEETTESTTEETTETAGNEADFSYFTYVEAPTVEDIPDGEIKAKASNTMMPVKTIIIEPKFGTWYLIISETETASIEDSYMGGQYLNVELPKDIVVGEVYSKELGTGGGFWQIWDTVEEGEEPHTTSWNAFNAHVIEFTKWDVKPYDPEGGYTQQAGTASGKLAVVYQAGFDFENSWAAGTFTDIPVIYKGEPDFEE